jgi:hypothetical protein
VRASIQQRLLNTRQNSRRLVQNLIVPEPQHTVTEAFQIGRALVIAGLPFKMLTAVGFNDQPGFNAREVDNIRFDDELPAEFESREPARA